MNTCSLTGTDSDDDILVSETNVKELVSRRARLLTNATSDSTSVGVLDTTVSVCTGISLPKRGFLNDVRVSELKNGLELTSDAGGSALGVENWESESLLLLAACSVR